MTDGLRVLVCGGRDFGRIPAPDEDASRQQIDWAISQQRTLASFMDRLQAERGPIITVMCGGMSGADYLAKQWAEKNGIQSAIYYANWSKFGKAAGPIRNTAMLRDGRPHIVVAFPGGPGTKDMVTKARAGGYEVIEVPAI